MNAGTNDISCQLLRLKQLCINFEAPKITITGKQQIIAQITDIINRPDICVSIDDFSCDSLEEREIDDGVDNAEEKVSWQSLFKIIFRVLKQEISKFVSSLESKSKRLVKIESLRLFKLILAKGFKVETALNVAAVSNFLLNCLQDDNLCSHYFKDFSDTLIDCLLKIDSAFVYISEETFKGFCSVYIDLLRNPQDNSYGLCSRVLLKLLAVGVRQFNVEFRTYARNVCSLYGQHLSGATSEYKSNLIACFNLLADEYSFEERELFCDLGESIALKILNDLQWNSEVYVEFFFGQVTLHHPRNVCLCTNGAIVNETWKDVAKELYLRLCEAFDKDLFQNTSFYSAAQRSKQLELASLAIDLNSRLILQVFEWGADIPFTAVSQLSGTFLKTGRKRISEIKTYADGKRACIEVGWVSFLQNLENRLFLVSSSNWLLVLKSVLLNGFDLLDMVTLDLISESVIKWFTICKKPEILKICCTVAKTFIDSLYKNGKTGRYNEFLLNLYNILVRLAYVKTVQNEIFAALSSVIVWNVIDSQRIQNDLCLLFTSAVQLPINSIYYYLSEFFCNCEFQDSLSNTSFITDSNYKNEKFAFRLFLVDYLLGKRIAFEDNALCSVLMSIPPHRLAASLQQICMYLPCKFQSTADLPVCSNFKNYAVMENLTARLWSLKFIEDDCMKAANQTNFSSTFIPQLVNRVFALTSADFEEILRHVSVIDVKVLNSLWSFYFYIYGWLKSCRLENETDMKVGLEKLFAFLSIQFSSSANATDFVDKMVSVVNVMDQNLNDFPEFVPILDFLDSTICCRAISNSSQTSVCDLDDHEVETKQESEAKTDLKMKSVYLLTQLSCVRVDCSMKDLAQEKLTNFLHFYFVDEEADLFVSKSFAVSTIVTICEVSYWSCCSLQLGNQLVLAVKNILNHCYQDFKLSRDVLKSCQRLSENPCFQNAELREKFFQILSGFKKMNSSICFTSKLKATVVQLLLDIETLIPGSKITFSENNNEVSISVFDCVFVFLPNCCEGLYYVCTFAKTMFSDCENVDKHIGVLFDFISNNGISSTKYYCFLRLIILLLKYYPSNHSVLVFYLCRLYSSCSGFENIFSAALQKCFSIDELCDIFLTNLPYVIRAWETLDCEFPFGIFSFDEKLKNCYSRIVSFCKVSGNEKLAGQVEAASQRKVSDFVDELWPEILIEFFVYQKEISPLTLDNFEQFSSLNSKTLLSEHFEDVFSSLINRLSFKKTCASDELSEKRWSLVVQLILKRLGYNNLTDCFSRLPQDTLFNLFHKIRLTVTGTKFYCKIRISRLLYLLNYLVLSDLDIFAPFLVKQFVLTASFVLRKFITEKDVDVMKNLYAFCQKLYKQIPMVFVNYCVEILQPLVQLCSRSNFEEATQLITFLFSCWTHSSCSSILVTPLLPPVTWLNNLREVQLKSRRDIVSFEEHVQTVLSSCDNFMQHVEFEYLCSLLQSPKIIILFDKFKIIQLLDKCRILYSSGLTSVCISKLVHFFYRRCFSSPILPKLHCSNESVFTDIVFALNKCFKSDRCDLSSAAWLAVSNFLSINSTKLNSVNFQSEISYLSPILKFAEKRKKRDNNLSEKITFNDNFYNFDSAMDFDSWISRFLPNFVSSSRSFAIDLTHLKETCEKSVSFCETLFSCLFGGMLVELTQDKREYVGTEFNKLMDHLIKNVSSIKKCDLRKFADLIISTLRRIQTSHDLACYNLLPIDYVSLARLCSVSDYYHEAVVFIEVAGNILRNDEISKAVYVDRSKKNILSCLNDKLSDVLQESFIKLSNTDAVYGLSESALSNPDVRSYLWIANHEWNKALSFFGSYDANSTDLYTKAAFALGMKDISFLCSDDKILTDYRCRCAVSLGEWDLVEVSKKKPKSFRQFIYDVVSCDVSQLEAFNIGLGNALIKNDLLNDSWANVQGFTRKLSLLNESVDYVENFPKSLSSVLVNWNTEANVFEQAELDEDALETIHGFRWAVLNKHLPSLFEKSDNFTEAVDCFVKITKSRVDWYLSQNMPFVALRLSKICKSCLKPFENVIPKSILFAPDFCEIETLWKSDEQFLAVSKLKTLQSTLEKAKDGSSDVPLLLAKNLVLLGEYQTKLDSPELAENSFAEAVKILESFSTCNTEVARSLSSAYASLAKYADENYQNLTDYIKSSNFSSKKKLIEQFKSVAVSAVVKQGKQYTTVDKKSNLDQNEVDEMIKAHGNLMHMAASYYMQCLSLSNEFDLKIFRVISLWFDNTDTLNFENFVDLCEKLPNYKWLYVWTQLTSRLSLANDTLSKTLYEIIQNTCMDHPYHTFYNLYSLAISGKNEVEDKNKKLRAQAAKKLLKELKASTKGNVFSDLIELAGCYMEVGKINTLCCDKKVEHALPKRIVDFNRCVPAITKTLTVQPSGKYKDFVSVRKFEPNFTLASGKSAPVILQCHYSDGTTKKQLVKGHDDTRQDAIMEQVFAIVNLLLQKIRPDKSSVCSNRMRTYNVIPLSSDCGVIEWCHGALSFGDYLVGSDYKSGAHKRLRPNDLVGTECRSAIADSAKQSLEKRIKVYSDVCTKLQPVFRHFFFERFLEPIIWYDACLNYTRSVAISSIVGHILGLSDRHTQNILIDEKTAEIIQIDLGMAFEQGKLLPTPEKVPFRLTRDVVDGMGVCGVEGVFRRTCERTMRLLRDSADILLPIVSVLLHDPVSEWVLTDSKIKKIQQSSRHDEQNVTSQTKNEHAERAILKVLEKLKGIEGTSILTVEGQVAYLINEARSHANLAQMFCGWQAYL